MKPVGPEGSETSSTAAKKIWHRKLVIPSSHGHDVVAAPLVNPRRSLRSVGAQSQETCWKVATVEFEDSHRIAVDVDALTCCRPIGKPTRNIIAPRLHKPGYGTFVPLIP